MSETWGAELARRLRARKKERGVSLDLDERQRREFGRWVDMLEREWGLSDRAAIVLRALRDAAFAANQGD